MRTPRRTRLGNAARGATLCATLLLACARREPAAQDAAPDTSAMTTSRAMASDQPERLVLPLAPPGAGRVVYQGVAPARADLSLPPPPAAVAEPPEGAAPEPPASASLELKPPIPRGSPRVASGGRGGQVTLDVRVDEHGEVSDVELVGTDADSLTVLAASDAAMALRYYPALLGTRPVAVWTRQVFEVKPGRPGRP